MSKSKSKQKQVRITLVKSPIGYEKSQGETARALGLRKMHATVTLDDNPAVRGMIRKISHLVVVDEVN
jgi:large subunit ribosomal protein L30